MSVVQMRLADVIRLDYCDFRYLNIKCTECNRRFSSYDYLDRGEYIAEHKSGKCTNVLTFDTLDVLLSYKTKNARFKYIAQSVDDNRNLPVARVWEDEIIDGGHRLAHCYLSGYSRILVETGKPVQAEDSGRWRPGEDIVT
jgi:hypothetical protein